MKTKSAVFLLISIGCSISSYANVLINDTWSDGTRTDPGSAATPPYAENNGVTGTDADADGQLESAWFGGGLTATTGHLTGTVGATSSASWTTYLTDTFGDSVNLANVGDTMTLKWVFTPSGVDTSGNTSQGIHIGVLQSPSGGRLTADGTPANQVYAGYGTFLNFGTTLKRSSNDNFDTMEWAVSGGANNILSTSAAYAKDGTGSGAINTEGYLNGTTYTYLFTATRTSTGLQIGESMLGGNIGGTGTLTNSFLDTTVSSYSFDTFAIRPTAASVSATTFDTSDFEVDFIPNVPEPTTFALGGLGMLALMGYRRATRK